MTKEESFASFWGHFEELRQTFISIVLIIVVSVFICWLFYEPLVFFIERPLVKLKLSDHERIDYFRIDNQNSTDKIIEIDDKSLVSFEMSTHIKPVDKNVYLIAPGGIFVFAKPVSSKQKLVVLSPLEGMLASLKTSLWIGIFASSPLWLFMVIRFLFPGLRVRERRLILPFLGASLLFILMGCFFAYGITIPMANSYLFAFNEPLALNLWSLGNYLDYTLFLMLANGFAFELVVIGMFAIHLKIVSAAALKKNRRYAILGTFVLAALLTPPDILTQCLLAIPLVILYEGLILYAGLRDRFSPTWRS